MENYDKFTADTPILSLLLHLPYSPSNFISAECFEISISVVAAYQLNDFKIFSRIKNRQDKRKKAEDKRRWIK